MGISLLDCIGSDTPRWVKVPLISSPSHNPLNEAPIAGTLSVTPPPVSLDTSTGISLAPWSGTSSVADSSPMSNISESSALETLSLPLHFPVCALSASIGNTISNMVIIRFFFISQIYTKLSFYEIFCSLEEFMPKAMFKFNPTKCAFLSFLSGVATLLVNGCKVDDRYSIDNIKDVNTEVTVFENGLTLPLIQSTARISVDSILKKAGVEESSFGEYLAKDSDGAYFISYATRLSLRESIDELDLKDILDISPVNFYREFSCELSSTDVSALKTESQEFAASGSFNVISINAGNIDPISHRTVLLEKNTIKDAADVASMAGKSSVTLPAVNLAVDSRDAKICGAEISDDIASIDEINMKKGSLVKVEVSVPYPIFSAGEITPDVRIDLGDILT